MKLRPKDYEFRRIAGVEVSPPPHTWFLSLGLWILVPLVILLGWLSSARAEAKARLASSLTAILRRASRARV